MATIILDDIPEKIHAGDSIAWKKSLSDFPADDSWILSYYFTKSDLQITFNASADGSDHLVDLDNTETTSWQAGEYSYQALAIKGTETKTIDEGIIEILPNLAAASSGLEARPHIFIMREALRAMVQGKATKDQLSLSINNRSISTYSPSEVRQWLDNYEMQCVAYRRKWRAQRGKPTGGQIKSRFERV
jgi:hypothetical protein